MKNAKRTLILLIVALSWTFVTAQPPYLSRRVTLDLPTCTLETALGRIAQAGGFRFSYDAGLIPATRNVTVKADAVPVHTLLSQLLGRDIQAREIGHHVILARSRKANREKQPYDEIIISGTVLDATDRSGLYDATVYETGSRRAVLTDHRGHYRLTIPAGQRIRGLSISRAGFADTVLFLRQAATVQADVLLRPLGEDLNRVAPLAGVLPLKTTDSLGLVLWLVPQTTLVNARNLEDRTTALVQASFIPYIGTNGSVTGSITNRFSLNVLAGYTGGLSGVEVGGLLNVTRNRASGIQIGGLGNIVGGAGRGLQIGGLFNYDLGTFHGLQIGGLFDVVPDTLSGVQINGLAGIVTGGIRGVQVSGLVNVVTGPCSAWQLAGLTNVTTGDARHVQASGLVNYCDNLDGVQVAGLINIAGRHNSGVQIAGLFNYATYVHGLQLGLINVAGAVERGVPIGLFSYVSSGYHVFEVSGNEIFYGNVAFRTGTRQFYNFVQFGVGGDLKLQGSYGIGTMVRLGKRMSLGFDASAGFVYHPTDTVYHGLLVKFWPSLEYRFAKHFSVFGGPCYNFFLWPKGKPSATARGLSSYDFYFRSTENASMQMWIGGMVGVRF